jgi:hypothetical protein
MKRYDLKTRAEQYGVSPAVADSLKHYIEDRIPTGGFLEAVLSNNLQLAVGKADSQHIHRLREILWLVNEFVPAGAHGSTQRVRAWLDGAMDRS